MISQKYGVVKNYLFQVFGGFDMQPMFLEGIRSQRHVLIFYCNNSVPN